MRKPKILPLKASGKRQSMDFRQRLRSIPASHLLTRDALRHSYVNLFRRNEGYEAYLKALDQAVSERVIVA